MKFYDPLKFWLGNDNDPLDEMEDPELNWHQIAWAKLPQDIRDKGIASLKRHFAPDFFEEVRALIAQYGLAEWQPLGWHFGQGMGIRNLFRKEVCPDSELPPFPEYYGSDVRNWDDYYSQIVEAACGGREVITHE